MAEDYYILAGGIVEGKGHMKAALWKYDKDLGIAFFCPDCKKFLR